VTINSLVVVLDVSIDYSSPQPLMPPGLVTLEGPDGTVSNFGSGFVGTIFHNDLGRVVWTNPAPFMGKSPSGTWRLSIDSATMTSVSAFALFIE
jgi:hypothetical protein